jgi:MFS transporter, ACDE family, multidrug resistance protein
MRSMGVRAVQPEQSTWAASLFRQPRSVWAVAFACVVSFMGIGLVDPILPTLAQQLHASPAQVSLLFTSYLMVTAVAMLITGWVSSRIGPKATLALGLVLIVAFSALAGSAGSVAGIVGFRAGWGLGNALFISTSLAVIVSSARGGFAGAILLYEAALGLGIAAGPLVGGLLGGISWRGPFFGVAVLMTIALVLVATLVARIPRPAQRTSITAPIRALGHRGLLTVAVTALLYNWGFFTVLGFSPYPMGLSIHELGWVFFGWGVLLAIFAVFVAPWAQRRIGTAAALYVSLVLLSADIAAMAIWTSEPLVMAGCVMASGAFLGLNNTMVTATVMSVAPVPRPVASAAYSFVRFFGGGLAPYVAGKLAASYDDHLPFSVGAAAVLLGAVVLATAHRMIGADHAATTGHAEASAPQPATEPAGIVVHRDQ